MKGALAFEMIFSSFFGVRFVNYRPGSQSGASIVEPEELYLDIDLDMHKATDKIFLVLHERRFCVMSGGLSFADIIYSGEFSS